MMSPRYALSRGPSLDITLDSEHTLVNITFTFPFSTPLSWVGWKTKIHRKRYSTAQSRCPTPSYYYISHKLSTPTATSFPPSLHQWKAVRSGPPMRRGPRTLPNLSHPAHEQTTIATSSPRVDSISGQHPEHPHASQAVAASPTSPT